MPAIPRFTAPYVPSLNALTAAARTTVEPDDGQRQGGATGVAPARAATPAPAPAVSFARVEPDDETRTNGAAGLLGAVRSMVEPDDETRTQGAGGA